MTCPAATPAIPNCGNGPSPKPKAPPKTTWATATIIKTVDGVFILPEPRMAEAKALVSQIVMAPEKAMLE